MVLPLPGQVNGKARAKFAMIGKREDKASVYNNLQDLTKMER